MRPVFAVVPDLLDYLRSTVSPAAEMRYRIALRYDTRRRLARPGRLGTENTTPWAKEKLFQIINHRYMERLPTVVTTNVEPDRIDGRIRSRLFDVGLSTSVFIEAADYRTRGIDLALYVLPPPQRPTPLAALVSESRLPALFRPFVLFIGEPYPPILAGSSSQFDAALCPTSALEE